MRIFPIFWEHPAVKGITFWRFRPGMWRTEQTAYIENTDGTERPAFKWLKAYIHDNFVLTESITVSTETVKTTIDSDNGNLQMVTEVLHENVTLDNVIWQIDNKTIAEISSNSLLSAQANCVVKVPAVSIEPRSNIKGSLDITISNQTSILTFNELSDIIVYPNPINNGHIVIRGIYNLTSVRILDTKGALMKQYDSINQKDLEVDID